MRRRGIVEEGRWEPVQREVAQGARQVAERRPEDADSCRLHGLEVAAVVHRYGGVESAAVACQPQPPAQARERDRSSGRSEVGPRRTSHDEQIEHHARARGDSDRAREQRERRGAAREAGRDAGVEPRGRCIREDHGRDEQHAEERLREEHRLNREHGDRNGGGPDEDGRQPGRRAAPTRTGASQGGASSPSSRVRAACQAMSPAPAAARRRFRILPSKAAVSSGNIANRGASSTGQSGG